MADEILKMSGVVGEISITRAGASVVGNPSMETTLNEMQKAALVSRSCSFILGDLMNYAESQVGDKYEEWSRITGLEIQTLKNISHTCRRIPLEMRRPDSLSFSNHRIIAGTSLSQEEMEIWISVAERHGMNQNRLRESLRLGRLAKDEDVKVKKLAKTDRGMDNIHPHVNRIFSLCRKMHREGDFDEMPPDDLYEFHRDLLPVVREAAEVWGQIRAAGDEALTSSLERDLLNAGIEFHEGDVIDV